MDSSEGVHRLSSNGFSLGGVLGDRGKRFGRDCAEFAQSQHRLPANEFVLCLPPIEHLGQHGEPPQVSRPSEGDHGVESHVLAAVSSSVGEVAKAERQHRIARFSIHLW